MKTYGIVLSSVVILGLLVIAFFVHGFFYGNLWSKHEFKQSVREYLKETYQEEMVISDVIYSFKKSTVGDQYFYAKVNMVGNQSSSFRVFRDENLLLTDNLITSSNHH